MSDLSHGNQTPPPEAEAWLEAVLESITDGFYAVDSAWRFVVFNRAAETYFGVRREQVLGRALFGVFPEGRDTKFASLCQAAMTEGKAGSMQAPSRRRPDRIVELRIAPMRSGGVAVVLTDVTDREAAEQRRRLMVNELNHRVKNTLATVQAIATQSLRGPDVSEAARERFKARLMALARANDVLVDDAWRGATLSDVAAQVASPYGGADPQRFVLEGPDVRLRPELAVAVTLALHELATNAAKYGALSAASGRVELIWSLTEEAFGLVWRESGGPPVTAPEKVGFGDRLIREGLGRALRGQVALDYLPTGLVCTVSAPRGGLGPQA
jgi:PAS domain S-box-containing protein